MNDELNPIDESSTIGGKNPLDRKPRPGNGPEATPSPWDRIERVVRKLRGKEGCEWDRAQTPESLAPYLIEEMHETCEALASGSREALVEEIGDAFYLWVFFLEVVQGAGRASVDDAARGIEAKLIRRHPRVFSDSPVASAADATPNRAWEMGKRAEADADRDALLPLPASMPVLLRARRLQEKAAAFGFDWPSTDGVIQKIREEVDELEVEIKRSPESSNAREELGDLLFAVVNIARHLGEDPQASLLHATEKFRKRFNAMVRSVEAAGHRMGDAPLDLMEQHWQSIKARQANENPPADRP
jgi:nucleoside triphosphate diphosphatase